MVTFLTIIHIIVCLFLILVVLLQAGKGGGMGIAFGGAGSQTVFGSSGAGNFLTRLTSITATVFLLTSLSLAHYSSQQDSKRLQRLASDRAAEKKIDDQKAAQLKADLEKARAAAAPTGSTAAGSGAVEGAPAGAPVPGALLAPRLQLKLPGGDHPAIPTPAPGVTRAPGAGAPRAAPVRKAAKPPATAPAAGTPTEPAPAAEAPTPGAPVPPPAAP